MGNRNIQAGCPSGAAITSRDVFSSVTFDPADSAAKREIECELQSNLKMEIPA
jgi:hypothetical protein